MKELQQCKGLNDVCVQFTKKDQLHCVHVSEVRMYKSYDACDGKSDGTKCTPITTAGLASKILALFEEPSGTCMNGFCNAEQVAFCIGKPDGQKCEFKTVFNGFLWSGRGKCQSVKEAKIPYGYCDVDPTERMPAHEPVAPIQVYDNRKNASDPTNVKNADLCGIFSPGTPYGDACDDLDYSRHDGQVAFYELPKGSDTVKQYPVVGPAPLIPAEKIVVKAVAPPQLKTKPSESAPTSATAQIALASSTLLFVAAATFTL
ncbi:hypothetical protein P43SY_001189 [Pythium insidiosum]|uniref:Uncharacterized protein n=1 Tax=Pythium insidiosum TaxID=114742 RepID=A0AAD5Q3H3_PYTIN|nr:hypothetical protein P43SY_001189 [Pythium insidiosum]